MGVVYLGETDDGQRAAVKLIRTGLEHRQEISDRFRREVRIAGSVDGPNVARIIDADIDADPPWLATEFIDGPTIAEHVEEHGPIGAEALRSIARALVAGLRTIHAAGIVHRDLSPRNVMLAPDGPRIVDFGIAHSVDSTTLTATGVAMGTPAWMAPEQLTGDRPTDKTDIHALGALLAYAATGTPPFGDEAPAAVGYRVVHTDPVVRVEDERLQAVIASALAKEPETRPTLDDLEWALGAGASSTGDVRQHLARLATGPRPVTALPTAEPPTRRRWFVAASLVLIVLLAGGVFTMLDAAPDPSSVQLDPPSTGAPEEGEITNQVAGSPPPSPAAPATPTRTPTATR